MLNSSYHTHSQFTSLPSFDHFYSKLNLCLTFTLVFCAKNAGLKNSEINYFSKQWCQICYF